MSLRKIFSLLISLALLLGAAAVPAAGAEAEILWLPEGVRFGTELNYFYNPELGWLDVSLDKWGFEPALYDLNTGMLVEDFDYVGPFSEGLAYVYKDGKAGFVDQTGQVVIPLTWDAVRDFHDGGAVAIQDGYYPPPYEEYFYLDYYLIDPRGDVVVHLGLDYGDVGDFHNGVACVWDYFTDESWYINTKGEVVEFPENTFEEDFSFDEGNLIVTRQKGKYGLVNKAGNVVVPFLYDYASWISEGPESQPGRYRYVRDGDRFGLVLDPTWQDPEELPPAIPWGTWGATAYPSTQTVEVDGVGVEFQMYALRDENGYDTNYVKLRDLAAVLNSFDVTWDGGISIETGKPYTPDGSEHNTPYSGPQDCVGHSAFGVTIDGEGTPLRAFVIEDANGGGYTYFQLRDLGKALNFNVGWTAPRGVFVETDKPYEG